MKKIIIAAIVFCAMFASCSTQQSAIRDLRSFTTELQMNSETYTLKDWKNAGERYVKINKRIAKHTADYTEEEVQEISELNGKCTRSFTEGAVNKINGAANAIGSFIKGFLK